MNLTDKKYYERQKVADKKHRHVVDKAKNRVQIAARWFIENKLTKETQPEFNALMKKADKEFEKAV